MLGQCDEAWRRQFNVGSLDQGVWLRGVVEVAAVTVLGEKAPDELEAYRALVLAVATAVTEAKAESRKRRRPRSNDHRGTRRVCAGIRFELECRGSSWPVKLGLRCYGCASGEAGDASPDSRSTSPSSISCKVASSSG